MIAAKVFGHDNFVIGAVTDACHRKGLSIGVDGVCQSQRAGGWDELLIQLCTATVAELTFEPGLPLGRIVGGGELDGGLLFDYPSACKMRQERDGLRFLFAASAKTCLLTKLGAAGFPCDPPFSKNVCVEWRSAIWIFRSSLPKYNTKSCRDYKAEARGDRTPFCPRTQR